MCSKTLAVAFDRLARTAPSLPHPRPSVLQSALVGWTRSRPQPALLEHLCRCAECLDLALWMLALDEPCTISARCLDAAWERLCAALGVEDRGSWPLHGRSESRA